MKQHTIHNIICLEAEWEYSEQNPKNRFSLNTLPMLNWLKEAYDCEVIVSVSAMLVETRQKNIAQAFILERYFFVSICPAAIPDTCLSVFLAAVLLLC